VPALQPDRRVPRTHRARHLFCLADIASKRGLTVDRFASFQRRQNEFAVCRHSDGNRYDINPVIADHREGIGIPAISTEGCGRFARALFVSRCDSREPHAGKTLDCGNVRHLRPACFGIRTDNSDTNFFLVHSSTPFFCKVIDTKLSIPSPHLSQTPRHGER
jgi:hypothetical protein